MGRLVVALLLVGSCFGQLSNNVAYVTVFTNKITTGVVAIPAQYNIGQVNHLLRLTTSNQPTKTCLAYSAPSIVLRFQGSWDNSTFFDIGVPITFTYTQPDGTFGAVRAFTGAYPWLQVNLQSADTTNCQHTLLYSGSISGTLIPDTFKWQDFGYVTVSQNLGVSSITTLTNGSSAGLRIAVYAVSIAGDGTNALNSTTFVNPGNTIIYWKVGILVASVPPYILPFTGKAYFTTELNSSGLALNIAGGAGSNGVANIVYRFE